MPAPGPQGVRSRSGTCPGGVPSPDGPGLRLGPGCPKSVRPAALWGDQRTPRPPCGARSASRVRSCNRARAPLGAAYRRREPEHTDLYRVVQENYRSFLALAEEAERPIPRHVQREFEEFLRCGILAHGFARLHCGECGFDRMVASSCRGRAFGPSCTARSARPAAPPPVLAGARWSPVRRGPGRVREVDLPLAPEEGEGIAGHSLGRAGPPRGQVSSRTGERLEQLGDGRLLLRLKRPWRDGTLGVFFEPLDLLGKLCPPRLGRPWSRRLGGTRSASMGCTHPTPTSVAKRCPRSLASRQDVVTGSRGRPRPQGARGPEPPGRNS